MKENRAFYKEKVQCADHKVHWTFLWETFLGRYTMVRGQVRKNVVYMQNEVRKNVIYENQMNVKGHCVWRNGPFEVSEKM